ncbi:MAG: 6-carboxytetrahydropterin synthase [Bryobacteraceae bacterium]
MKISRTYRFAASHRLHSPQLSSAENEELYGKCNNPHGHGHNYALVVGVRGQVNADTGRIVDIGKLDQYVEERVLRVFDHKDMNRDVPEFASSVPTTENLILDIERRLRSGWTAAFSGAVLDHVRIRETRRNSFELKEL